MGSGDEDDTMSWDLVEAILTAAGTPVAGHTLSVPEMQRAVAEGRVLKILFWSSMGDSEAAFEFATDFGIVSEGRVHPTYLVFPKPIPEALRRRSSIEWEEIEEVFAAFGVPGYG
jgi:hypothetical protein